MNTHSYTLSLSHRHPHACGHARKRDKCKIREIGDGETTEKDTKVSLETVKKEAQEDFHGKIGNVG